MRSLQNMIMLAVGDSVLGSCKVSECLSHEVSIVRHSGYLRRCCTYTRRKLIPWFKSFEHFIRLWWRRSPWSWTRRLKYAVWGEWLMYLWSTNSCVVLLSLISVRSIACVVCINKCICFYGFTVYSVIYLITHTNTCTCAYIRCWFRK